MDVSNSETSIDILKKDLHESLREIEKYKSTINSQMNLIEDLQKRINS